MTLDDLIALFDAFALAALADLVSRVLSEPNPWSMRFDDLVWAVRLADPEVDVIEIDAAARPYERGEPGAFTYEAIS